MATSRRPFGQRYAFVVVGLTFLSLLIAAGVRSTPGVLLVPWRSAFGWDRSVIALAAGIGIFFYGLVGPFAAALMQALGVRRTLFGALALMSVSSLISVWMTAPWQLILTWGVMSGIGSGCVAMVLGATVANRWFVANRGLVMGLLSASAATGTLIFLPVMAAVAEAGGWRPVVCIVAAVTALLVPLTAWLMPERPSAIGVGPYGSGPDYREAPPANSVNPAILAIRSLAFASKTRDFWLLFSTFFVCGFTTNGLIGTHMIAFCADNGMPETRAAGFLAAMGVFDLIGTTASGWLTDRLDARKLLFVYYALRALSLVYLPFSNFSLYGLSIFAVFYGLDWIATVPPTLRLTNQVFGDRNAPLVFGWIVMGHQLGAASAALLGGALRTIDGNYLRAFVIAGSAAALAAILALLIGRPPRAAGDLAVA
jgi:predicted MFS family arabinose efflux permease